MKGAPSRGRGFGVLAASCLWATCAAPPKPPELEAFEKLRANPAIGAAAKRSPDLVNASDNLLARAQKEWDNNDLDEARSSALLGQIKLKHALAFSDQDSAKRRSIAADKEAAQANEEMQQLERDLASVNDQVALLEKLRQAAADKEKLAQQLSVAEQKASAEKQGLATELANERLKAWAAEKVSAAELAIKAADTVDARQHARSLYEAATSLIERSKQEILEKDFKRAEASAELAKIKAEQAAAGAKPLYDQEVASAENKARAEALSRDAAGLAGIEVRRDARGSLQRLVLPVPASDLFNRREPTIALGKDVLLDSVAGLLKKYPTYPVQIVGYTDTRGKAGELLALSLARAQSVFSALALRGADAKRMLVSGQGGAEPVSDNRTTAGRARNNRVEIIFLYQ